MNARTWILLNVALLALAGIGIGSILGLLGELREQKAQTARVISGETRENTSAAGRGGHAAQRKGPGRNTAAEAKADTWPAIRRGSLADTWQKTLFNKDRCEKTAAEDADGETKQEEEELPAPPNFELIGILTANDCKVAIIELKNSTAQRNIRRPMGGRQQALQQAAQRGQDAKANENSFEPTFVTAHEEDMLQTTGYKVSAINEEEKAVLLTKDGLEYKLKLDKNNANAAKRRDSQNSYAQSVQDKARAAAANASTARQVQAAQQNASRQQQRAVPASAPPMPPGMNQGGNRGGQFQANQDNGAQNNGTQQNANWRNNGRFQRFNGQNGGGNQPARQQ